MDILYKLKNKLVPNFGGGVAVEPVPNSHDYLGSMVDKYLNSVDISGIRIAKTSEGVEICVIPKKEEDSQVINYCFNYNADGLLLLRGVETNVKRIPKSKKISIISKNSIPDFAIAARPAGSEKDFNWVPIHGKALGVSLNTKIEFKVNGQIVSKNALNSIDIDDFEIVQSFNARNLGHPTEVLWKHTVIHSISKKEPCLSVSNRVDFLRETEIKNMYLTMLPATSKSMDKLYLNDGSSFPSIPMNNSELKISTGADSAVYLGKYGDFNYICAVDILDKKEGKEARVTFRGDNVTKFYLDTFNGIAKKGQVFTNTQRLLVLCSVDSLD